VIVEEITSSLRGRLADTDYVLGDARLTDVDAEFQQFPVEARRTQSGFWRLMVRMSWRTSFEILADLTGRAGFSTARNDESTSGARQ